MLQDAVAVATLMKAIGYGIPAALVTGGLIVFLVLARDQKSKTERDRREHMVKWESMIKVQERAIDAQKASTASLITTHQEEVVRLIAHHKDEIDRMFQISERQASQLEVMGRNLTLISDRMEKKSICPNQKKG